MASNNNNNNNNNKTNKQKTQGLGLRTNYSDLQLIYGGLIMRRVIKIAQANIITKLLVLAACKRDRNLAPIVLLGPDLHTCLTRTHRRIMIDDFLLL